MIKIKSLLVITAVAMIALLSSSALSSAQNSPLYTSTFRSGLLSTLDIASRSSLNVLVLDTLVGGIDVVHEHESVYWTELVSENNVSIGGNLYKTNLQSGDTMLLTPTGVTPRHVVVDVSRNTIFWVELIPGRLMSCDLSDCNPRTVTTISTESPNSDFGVGAFGLALDTIRQKAYFGGLANKIIYRVNYDGSQRDELVVSELSGLSVIGDLAVDAENGFLYWGERFDFSIKRCSIDLDLCTRSDIQTVVNAFAGTPLSLSLSQDNRTLFWADRQSNEVKSKDVAAPDIGSNTSVFNYDTVSGQIIDLYYVDAR